MPLIAGSPIDITDWDLPDPAVGSYNSANTITSASWAVLPSGPATCDITNPHPTAPMLTLLTFGCWCAASTGDVRVSLAAEGATNLGPGVGNLPAGWGEVIIHNTTGSLDHSKAIPVSLAPGATTFKLHAYRTGTGTVTVSYPVVRAIPLRYIF